MDLASSGYADLTVSFMLWVWAVVFGLALGSFATAVAYRVPRGIPWAFGNKLDIIDGHDDFSPYRSACTRCLATLKPIDLIPLFSWISTRGRCRYCKAKISSIYPVTELLTLLATLCVFFFYGFSLSALFVAFLVPFLVALMIVDLERMVLPNQLVFVVGVLGALRLGAEIFIVQSLSFYEAFIGYVLAAPVYGLLAWLLGWLMTSFLKKDALGFGDVKFFMVAGLWIGLSALGMFCVLSGAIGFAFALIWRYLKKQEVFPFGPALIMSLFVLLFFDTNFLP